MEITKDPAEILHKKLEAVTEITDQTRDFIAEMRKAMIKAKGVGLAGNQAGQDMAIFVIDKKLAEENNVPDAYINPEITEYGKEMDAMEEGCLSLPGFWHEIKRSKKVHLKALDENGNKVKIKARGFLARVFQHEYDHLCGLLIKDRAK